MASVLPVRKFVEFETDSECVCYVLRRTAHLEGSTSRGGCNHRKPESLCESVDEFDVRGRRYDRALKFRTSQILSVSKGKPPKMLKRRPCFMHEGAEADRDLEGFVLELPGEREGARKRHRNTAAKWSARRIVDGKRPDYPRGEVPGCLLLFGCSDSACAIDARFAWNVDEASYFFACFASPGLIGS
jgi:hypothetical protein